MSSVYKPLPFLYFGIFFYRSKSEVQKPVVVDHGGCRVPFVVRVEGWGDPLPLRNRAEIEFILNDCQAQLIEPIRFKIVW